MFSFLNPWVILTALLIIIGVYSYGHHSGYQERVAEDQAEIIRLNDEARAKEAELNTKLARATSQLKQAKNDIKTRSIALNSDADAGRLRLCPASSVQADTSASNGDRADESQSERETVKALISIAQDGDTAITSLNACISQYNEVMKTVNEGVK